MEKQKDVTTLFLDVGGVMLTDGWDRNSRAAASKLFKIDHQEMEERHHLNFETYELGRMSLNQYLERVIFYESRSFSKDDFTAFMYKQSLSFTNMINFFIRLKEKFKLKITVISNEGQELNEYRIKNFKLNEFVDFFISSSFVQLRKPDLSIFRMALNIAQVKASESIYIDNQPLFVSIAEEFGMQGIVHKNYDSTVEAIATFGWII